MISEHRAAQTLLGLSLAPFISNSKEQVTQATPTMARAIHNRQALSDVVYRIQGTNKRKWLVVHYNGCSEIEHPTPYQIYHIILHCCLVRNYKFSQHLQLKICQWCLIQTL